MNSGIMPGSYSTSVDAKLVYAYGYLMIPDATNKVVLHSTNKFTAFNVGGPWEQTWANGKYYSTLFDISEDGIALMTTERLTSYNYRNLVYMKGPIQEVIPQSITTAAIAQGSSRFSSAATAIWAPSAALNRHLLGTATNKKISKAGKTLPSTMSCQAYNPINKKFMAIGTDGFIYEADSYSNAYVKNTATVIPAGVYKDMTFAGGKFCAAIYNTNKFVVIG